MDDKFYLNAWRKAKLFKLEKDKLKSKKYIYSSFPIANKLGFLDANIRKYFYADFYSRYYRMNGYNVLFGLGYQNLASSSFIETRNQANNLDDTLIKRYQNQLSLLGIGYDDEKEINMINHNYLLYIQKTFLHLYENKRVYYKECDVYYIPEKDKILNDFEIYIANEKYFSKQTNEEVVLKKMNLLVLDINAIANEVANSISKIEMDNNVKKQLIDALLPYDIVQFKLSTTANLDLSIEMETVEYLGAISFIALNPNKFDISKFISDEELEIVEYYLCGELVNKGAFSGNFATNILTGLEIPIFISNDFEESIHLGIPIINENDYSFANYFGLSINNIIKNNKLINSDFLDGCSLEEARENIIEAFLNEDLITLKKCYRKTEIIISSQNHFGALIPLLLDSSKERLYLLNNNIPITFSNKFRPIIYNQESIEDNGQLVNGSLNNLFCSGLCSLSMCLYDDKVGILDLFSLDAIKELNDYKTPEYIFIDEFDIFNEILMPQIFIELLKKEFPILQINSAKKVIITNEVLDKKGQKITKKFNNYINIEDVVEKYSADAVRMYLLKTNSNTKICFDEEEIGTYNTFLNSVKKYFEEDFVSKNFNVDYYLHELSKEISILIKNSNLDEYINKILDFFKEKIFNNNITIKQASQFLIYLSLVAPFTAERINQEILKNKNFILDEEFPK